MMTLNQIGTRLSREVSRFVRNRDGNIGLLFALTVTPMIVAIGSAVDYSRGSDARTTMMTAVDSTALAMAKRAAFLSDTQLQKEGQAYYTAVLQGRSPELAANPITVRREGKNIRVIANGTLPTYFMQMFGHGAMPIGVEAVASFGQRKVELALVLDNTGSMSSNNKMTELKKATLALIDQAESIAPTGSDRMKVSIVPFDTQVRVNAPTYRFQSWLAFRDKPEATHTSFDDIRPALATQAAWDGCIADRAEPHDTSSRAPVMALPQTFHPAVKCNQNLARIQTLTDKWGDLRNTVNEMKPTGCTNISVGARFGLATLSDSGPLAGGVAFGTPNVDKYMVILTDGDNTQNRFVNGCSGAGNRTLIDAKTRSMCDLIAGRRTEPGQPSYNVKVFTVRVIDGNQALLSSCASDPKMAKQVNSASEIGAVFQDILNQISSLRLAS
jgi:Flp pilus assembly protein TadG